LWDRLKVGDSSCHSHPRLNVPGFLVVRSLEEALTCLPASAIIIEKAQTPYGTVEALVEDDGQCMILAEKRPSPHG
jgi:hypothetical protein